MRLTRNLLLSSLPSFDVVDETGQEGTLCRAEKRLPERTGKYWAVDGTQVSFVLLKNFVQIIYLTRNSLPLPSRPSK